MDNYKITITPISEEAIKRWGDNEHEITCQGFALGASIDTTGDPRGDEAVSLCAHGVGVGRCIFALMNDTDDMTKAEILAEMLRRESGQVVKRSGKQIGKIAEEFAAYTPASDETADGHENRRKPRIAVVEVTPDDLKNMFGIKH